MMKNLFLFFCMALFGLSAMSQTVKRLPLSTTNHTNLDTVTNTGVRIQGIQILNYDNLSIQANVTKISGTAGGQVILVASQDSLGFEPIPSLKKNGTFGLDTMAVANVSTVQIHSFVVPRSYWNYYGLQYTGTGTMACKFKTSATQKTLYSHSQ